MSVSRQQADWLAPLIADCRPHGARRWDIPGIHAAIARVNQRQLVEVIRAFTRGAEDRTAHTPSVVVTNPTYWREPALEQLATRAQYCRTHSTALKAGVCPSCRADQIGADGPATTARPSRGLPRDQVAAIVGELRDHAHHTPETQ
ncbi:hypothetical protein [Nocardioides panaciterrulae]|uniref:Uncharacterized protein n=1 Tax=Nocardioides panaciterrulae TaxID=661492 RepID=A0A7Y9JD60_9ACTN|nr:hypothetical protein [Nocardioides panaciterrulae]NYD43947.1 hypothetical protein [Nocardioides panaciterrulae]NYD44016.1 hypothetical protein [Nocardioides panaciterrulae]